MPITDWPKEDRPREKLLTMGEKMLTDAADKEVTMVIKQALALVDIQVVDHIIVGNSQNFSFADAGLLI